MNRNLTIGLVVVALLLGAYVIFVQRPRDLAANVTPTVRATQYLWTLTAEEVSGLRLDDLANSRAIELAKDSAGVWTLVEPGPQAADQTAVSNATSSLTSLTINNTITATTDLTPYGVLSPTYRLTLNLTDGRTLAAAIGDKAPTGTSYYVLRDGESTLVTVASFGLDRLIGLLDEPPVAPPTATPTAAATGGTPGPEATEGDITEILEATATP